MTGSSGAQVAPAAHGCRHAPPLHVRPAPHGLPSQSESRQSTNPSQSSSVPPEHVVSVVAVGVHVGPGIIIVIIIPPAPAEPPPPPPSGTWPMTLCALHPPRASSASGIHESERDAMRVLVMAT